MWMNEFSKKKKGHNIDFIVYEFETLVLLLWSQNIKILQRSKIFRMWLWMNLMKGKMVLINSFTDYDLKV